MITDYFCLHFHLSDQDCKFYIGLNPFCSFCQGKSIIAFCNDADTKQRNDFTLRISFDEGNTWKKDYAIDKSPGKCNGDFTGYSDITKIAKHRTGVLYAKDNYAQTVFAIVDWNEH